MAEPLVPLDPAVYRQVVSRALAEDLGRGDLTTEGTIPADLRAIGEIVAAESCVVAGLDVAVEVFVQLDSRLLVDHMATDGDACHAGARVLRVVGLARALLTAERTALNFLQRLSGIATLTRRFVDAAAGRTVVLDTRKTTPTLRALEKHAVRAGGGVNHRMALDDGILIKDNHVCLAGSIRQAVEAVRRERHEMPIEVEAQTLQQVAEAVACGVDVVLVDNLPPDGVEEAVRLTRGHAKVEVSGGVTLDRMEGLAALRPEFVSVGALTHSAPAIDFSFDLCREPSPPR